MPNKTPYELRFDVLQMARDLEMQQYEVLMNSFWALFNQFEEKIGQIGVYPKEAKEAADALKIVANDLLAAIPTMPTSDQINRRAKELYEFVESK